MFVTKSHPTTGNARATKEQSRALCRLLEETLISAPVDVHVAHVEGTTTTLLTRALPSARFVFTTGNDPDSDPQFSLLLSVPGLSPFYCGALRDAVRNKYEIFSDVGDVVAFKFDMSKFAELSPAQIMQVAILFESEVALLLRTYEYFNSVTIKLPMYSDRIVGYNQQIVISDFELMVDRAVERIYKALGIAN